MVRGTTVFARIVPFQTALLMAIALKHRGVQIQHRAQRRRPQPAGGKLPQHRRQMFDLATYQPAQIARHRHRCGDPLDCQNAPDHLIATQALDVRKAPRSGQHRNQKHQHRVHHRDLIGRGAPISQTLAQQLAHPQPIHVPHHRNQTAPSAQWLAGIPHLQAGAGLAKSATFFVHRPVPPLRYGCVGKPNHI